MNNQSSQHVVIAEHLADSPSLAAIAPLIEQGMDNTSYPGAIILASHQNRIIYRGVFGYSRIMPDYAAMQFDTVFDLASLTKVIVTTTAILQLMEQNQLLLDTALAEYWPAFASQGKAKISLRQLLTHTSGLPPVIYSPALKEVCTSADKPLTVSPTPPWRGYDHAISMIEQSALEYTPGSKFVYGDLNFIALGHLIQLMTNMPLHEYAEQAIFKPLGMNSTRYLPFVSLNERMAIAPTQVIEHKLRWAEVHDPTTYLMGGISGAAGIFSSAGDIGLFADCILNQGMGKEKRILNPDSVKRMTSPQTPAEIPETRGLGWDINSPYSCRGGLWPLSSFNHTGWTGTSLLLDPVRELWLLILTSRAHPHVNPKGTLVEDRRRIADLIAKSLYEAS